ncbi:MAG: tyrosine--tRNA ligase [Candidatus Omnitrophica bacterium]|nr:tyrosine--tRNA ligase [Candidatus Omnitrophota bacterium]
MPGKNHDLELLCQNAVEVIDRKELELRLAQSGRESKPLRIKAGFDPSSPDIHLGHTVLLRKLRQFQDLGHKVIFIIGDYTAMIGDPTGQTKTRPALSNEEVEKNAKTYQEQAFKILDKNPSKIEIIRNSDWLSKPEMFRILLGNLGRMATVAQILERDDFEKRMEQDQPVTISEFLYPLIQGYDSVQVRADIELGGTDQKFNLLMGRDLQRAWNQKPQVVMTLPLLVGLDGKQKMSKSLGNAIGVMDSAKDMFGKAMSIPDSLMESYYRLLLPLEESAINNILNKIKEEPRNAKHDLARRIVEQFHSVAAAQVEVEEWDRVYSKREAPSQPDLLKTGESSIGLADAIKRAGAANTTSDAFRLIQQGGVTVDGVKITDPKHLLIPTKQPLVRAGKKKYFKLIPSK